MSFPRYPKYKDSGLQWLDSIPENWDIVRLKNVLECRITDGPHTTPEFIEEGIPFLSVDGIQGGELILEGCRYISHEAHDEYRKKAQPQKNDILMGKAASTGKIARVKTQAIFSIWSPLALIRIESRLSSPQFYEQVLKSAALQFQIDVLCTSNTQKNISMDDIPRLAMTKPPLEEQIAIARFIDRETTKIDALIAEQKHLIELLEEKRQAVISHAVTKGLNPNAPMKDSGVEWLGEVPEHWAIKKLRYVCKIQTGSRDTEEAIEDGEYPFFVRSQTIERINSYSYDCEAVLTAGDGAGVGKVFHYYTGFFDFHQRVYMLNEFNDIHGKLIYHFLKTNFFKVALQGGAKSTVDSLRRPMFTGFPVCIPPKKEQGPLLEFIEDEEKRIDKLITTSGLAVSLLQERRSALISAAVTGQIDVRGLEQEVAA